MSTISLREEINHIIGNYVVNGPPDAINYREDYDDDDETADLLEALFHTRLKALDEKIEEKAIVTLDTDPVNKAMVLPVGKFVRLDDVHRLIQEELKK